MKAKKLIPILLAAPLVVALAQSYFGPSELEAIKTGGKTYADVFLNQRPDQALCSIHRNRLPGDLLPKFLEEQRALIKYPQSGKLMGDWKKGGAIFNNLQKANCFSCHFGSPVHLGGDVGPSLEKYGLKRGQSEAVQRYTYEVIYNSWAYFPCTVMYRFGAQGLLTPEEIADVVAYLLDPESDFNTKPAVGSK
ncbi:sulfur oxidation c-type cytochrome SoxX [Thermus antranikianii]|jgi:sulfur-oxidizing protein SoxX|uniref:Sulfur oxidation c-type cytochrome SoxX n=1 Tax=Thermus antranikianii TaxID=88190 RepID=A0ABY7RN22_9DEIN|nr:sulfur oxidation c-type cytochrome SoxX [Thermus antranikianii]QWK22294.1 MAG: sulfur oxidation c-type cytochrome SoxX [Thermus antranikianii]WCM39048.1 sulfur oxidation c-type cytochrome SoxX [Thermus antranikianii]